jgi:hypothetical protein
MDVEKKKIRTGLTLLFLLFSLGFFISQLYPFVFSHIQGEERIDTLVEELKSSNQDKFAENLVHWEAEHITSPYLASDDSLHQILLYYQNNHGYSVYQPLAGTPWLVESGLAACGGFARVFAEAMEERGYTVQTISAHGDDHAWARYKAENTWVAVDPSTNNTRVNRSKLGKKKELSLVTARKHPGGEITEIITDRYVDTGTLYVQVTGKNDKPVEDSEVEVRDPRLSKAMPYQYDEPRLVAERKTNSSGAVEFSLGPQRYLIKLKNRNFILADIYERNVTVESNQLQEAEFNLVNDSKRTELVSLSDIIELESRRPQ